MKQSISIVVRIYGCVVLPLKAYAAFVVNYSLLLQGISQLPQVHFHPTSSNCVIDDVTIQQYYVHDVDDVQVCRLLTSEIHPRNVPLRIEG